MRKSFSPEFCFLISSSNFDLIYKKDIFANPELTKDNFKIMALLRHGRTPPKATHQKSDPFELPWLQKVKSSHDF